MAAALTDLPPAELAALRGLHEAGDTSGLHAKLKALGFEKMGQRARAIGALADTASATAAAAPAAPAAEPRAPVPRIAFVCHTGYFASGTYGGATRASLAMLRDARRICNRACGGGGVDVLALVQTPVPEALVAS